VIFFLALAAIGALAAEQLESDAFGEAALRSDDLAENALPSLIALGELRRALRRLDRDHVSGPATDAAWSHIEDIYDRYRALPNFPGEEEIQDKTSASLARVEILLHGGGASGALSDALAETARNIDALSELNTRGALMATADLVRAHRRARSLSRLVIAATLVLFLASAALSGRIAAEHGRRTQALVAEMDAFAGRVAHEIRGHLGALMLALGQLRQVTPGSAGAIIDRADRTIEKMTRVVDALLDFSRAGGRPAPGAPASIEAALSSVVASLGPLAQAERAQLDVRCDARTPVRATQAVVESIVGNLARNALLYLGDAPTRRVTIRATTEGSRASIAVEDTGPGISRDLQPELFAPFRRGSTRTGGVGLGLATVKRLVEAHDGTISLATTEGKGTRFEVRLPLAE
jgi:signal transduction histidine kinase